MMAASIRSCTPAECMSMKRPSLVLLRWRGSLVRRHRDEAEIREAVGRRRRTARRRAAGAVSVKQWAGGKAGAERRHHVAFLAKQARIGAAAGGAPHRRVWLLVGARPQIDV